MKPRTLTPRILRTALMIDSIVASHGGAAQLRKLAVQFERDAETCARLGLLFRKLAKTSEARR